MHFEIFGLPAKDFYHLFVVFVKYTLHYNDSDI